MLAFMEENDEIRDWLQHWGLDSPHQSLIELECFGQKKRLGEVVRCVAVGLRHRKCVAFLFSEGYTTEALD